MPELSPRENETDQQFMERLAQDLLETIASYIVVLGNIGPAELDANNILTYVVRPPDELSKALESRHPAWIFEYRSTDDGHSYQLHLHSVIAKLLQQEGVKRSLRMYYTVNDRIHPEASLVFCMLYQGRNIRAAFVHSSSPPEDFGSEPPRRMINLDP